MIAETLVKAENFVKNGEVNLDVETVGFIYFTVKRLYDVYYDKARNKWCCTCIHGSMWRFNTDQLCSHIRACQLIIETFKKK